MGAKARGFLLLSFAFTSVLSSAEIIVPSKELEPKPETKDNRTSDAARHGNLDSFRSETNEGHDLEKRAAGFTAGNGDAAETDKRAPSAFHGMRGKKEDVGSSLEPNFLVNPEELEKRAPSAFHGMRGKKEETRVGFDPSYFYSPDDLEKRAPMGFHGMRGKKTVFGPEDAEQNEFLEDWDKRAPVGFHGMRGKKDDDAYDKRASMSFHGMRGKKDDEYPLPYSESFEPEAYFGYEPELDRSDEILLRSGLYDDDVIKRASSGFHGMRGKKFDEEPFEEYDKRASMAFHGMRGKKENDFNYKRAMGFMGMRGKKSLDVWGPDEFDKRAPQSGFFGMRGKKAPSNAGFFGMRGKKAPSGFFGTKGKRDPSDNEYKDMNSLLNSLTEADASRERTRRGTSWLRNSKKAKSAFFGMRGKKSWLADDGSILNYMTSSE